MPHPLVVHCKRQPFDVYIGRPGPWGNPFPLKGEADRANCIYKYGRWLAGQPELIARAKAELKGRVLGCFCAPKPCHGDILASVANGELEL